MFFKPRPIEKFLSFFNRKVYDGSWEAQHDDHLRSKIFQKNSGSRRLLPSKDECIKFKINYVPQNCEAFYPLYKP